MGIPKGLNNPPNATLPQRNEALLRDGIAGGSCKITPFISHLGHVEGEQPQLGDLLTMITNHLLNGMILQVPSNGYTVAPPSDGQIPLHGS